MEATTKSKLVDYRVKNGVATFELTFETANCYTYEMMSEIDAAILQEARVGKIVRVIRVGDADRRHVPRILHFGIECDAVGFDRE